MKAKVLIEFTDKVSRNRFKVGADFEGTVDRCNELAKKGIIKVTKEETAAPKPKK